MYGNIPMSLQFIKAKGLRSDPSNFRPISVTSIFSKILEKIVFKYIFNFLSENNIISKNQSGFLPKDSTTFQLLNIYDTIVKHMD